jgi:hypothetical protein
MDPAPTGAGMPLAGPQLMLWRYIISLFETLMIPKSSGPPLRKRTVEISYFDQYTAFRGGGFWLCVGLCWTKIVLIKTIDVYC